MNIQGFYTGREFDADTFFGAHPYEGGTHFAVWAPSARDVKVITSGLSDGSWAEWQMHRSYSGCWEADAAGVTRGTCYQYRVCGADGSVVGHCAPMAAALCGAHPPASGRIPPGWQSAARTLMLR